MSLRQCPKAGACFPSLHFKDGNTEAQRLSTLPRAKRRQDAEWGPKAAQISTPCCNPLGSVYPGTSSPETESLLSQDTQRHFHILGRASPLVKPIRCTGFGRSGRKGQGKERESVSRDKSPVAGGRDGIQERTDPLPDLDPLKQFPYTAPKLSVGH